MAKGLQAELKQSIPFRSPATEALLSILRTAAVIEHRMGEELKQFGITGPQHNVLRILRGAGDKGLCGRDIGERMVARVPDVPRMLDRMEAMKLISRERDQDDRRHVTARITQKGLDLLTKVDPAIDQAERARFSGIDESQIRAIIDNLGAVREAFC
jgi:DNA-binding MarR family transcriptional regulator